MKMTKPVIIILAVALVAVIGYVFYLYQGPLKNISIENQELKNEIAYLKTASGEIKAAYNSDLSAKIRLEEALQKKNMELEQTVEEIRKEKEMAGTDFQKKIESLEKLLAQNDRNLQIFREKKQQLKTTETELHDKVQNLEHQLAQKVKETQTSHKTFQQLRSEEVNLKGKIKSLENTLVRKEREKQTTQDENRELQKTIVTLEDNRAALVQKSAYLDKQLQASKKQIEELNQELAAREAKIEKMAQEHQTLVSQIDTLEEKRESLNRKTQDLNSQLGLSRTQLDAVSQEAFSKEKKLLTLNKSYEELQTRLSKQIQEKELKISTLEGKLNIRLLNKILFAPGQTVISPNGKRVLKSLAEELKKVEGVQISVEGHTDNQPLGRKIKNIYIDNLGLSVARSAAVARTLRKMGVNPQKLSAAGYSMHRPLAANDAPEGQQQNRRVEIVLTPLQ